MRGKSTSEQTKAKVTELKIQNIELSSYDIAKQLEWTEWEVSADTIQDIIKDLPQVTATEPWKAQIDRLDSIISVIEAITNKSVIQFQQKDYHTVNDIKTLNDIAKNNFDRKQILTGKPTDIFKHEWLSTEQADKIAKLYNNGNT